MHEPRSSLRFLICLVISLWIAGGRTITYALDVEFLTTFQNELRERVGSPPFMWNESTAERARRLAISTGCRYSSKTPFTPPDQIIFYSKEKTPKDAIRNFKNALDWESYGYFIETNSCPDGGYPCPNFPKMASWNVTSVGCGSILCKTGTLIVCVYSSPPSIVAYAPIGDGGTDL